MSLFTKTVDDQSTPGSEETTQTTDYVAQLKELRGDNFADPQVMAKSLIEGAKHIDKIEAENADYKKSNEQKDWAEEVISRLNQGSQTSTAGSEPTGVTKEATPAAPSADDIKSLIEQTITSRDQAATAAQNEATVEAKMTEMFGTEAATELSNRAKAVNMSTSRLQELAQESPSAFFTLIGAPAGKETNAGLGSSVNTGSFNQSSNEKNWAYYQKLRKEDIKAYRSPAVQDELLAQRKKLGDSFYS